MSNHVLIWASRFIELAAFMVFLNKVPLRREGSLLSLVELVLFSVLLVLVRDLCGLLWNRYPELLYINLFYYPCVWCFVRLRYDLKWRQTIYYVLMLFLGVQSLRLLLHLLSNSLCGTDYFNVFTEESLPMNLLWLSLYWGTLVLTFRLLKKHAVSGSISDLNNYSLLMMTVIAVPVFFLGDSVVWVKEPGLRLCCAVMGEVSSICGIVGITGYLNLQALEKQKLELARMEGILESQDRRQRMELENIASLNRRYHDLKNHMLYFRQQGLTPEGREYIADVEREIQNYEAIQHTGNEALDGILTVKYLECARKQIRFVVIADGATLSFIRPLDFAGIFGNALDNAITAVEELPESQREITVRMSESEGWLSIRFSNPCGGPLRYSAGGTLLSSKRPGEQEGIGLKSIRMTIEKYGGVMNYQAEDGLFSLCILFPRQDGTAGETILRSERQHESSFTATSG